MKAKGKKGFSIVNIILGVILTMAGFAMFADPSAFPGPLIAIPLGLFLWIFGAVMLRKLKRHKETNEEIKPALLTTNLVLFILSCIILAACTVLPIIGPML